MAREKEGVVAMSEATKRVIEYLHKENEELKAKCDLLEKALDKACGELNSWVNDSYTSEEWREWCLHDENS